MAGTQETDQQNNNIPLKIPGLDAVKMTRTDADRDLCALCESVPNLARSIYGDYSDATEIDIRCKTKDQTTDATVTVTVLCGTEAGKEPVKPRELFCWVAHAKSRGTGM